MKFLASLLIISALNASASELLPLADGIYTFTYKDAEFPSQEGHPLKTKIAGGHISLVNETESSFLPLGLIDEGALGFHKRSNQWIIVRAKTDLEAKEVGGCSDGPTVVDLKNKIYWSC